MPLEKWKEAELLQKKLVELYRWFFVPDYLTEMDRFVESRYLDNKLKKMVSYRRSKVG